MKYSERKSHDCPVGNEAACPDAAGSPFEFINCRIQSNIYEVLIEPAQEMNNIIEPSQNAPLGRAVIGGLLLATVATLFFVPVVYSILRKKPPMNFDTAGNLPESIAVGDVNGDGKLDALVVNNNVRGSVSVLLNQTAGAVAFSAPTAYTTDGTPARRAVRTATAPSGCAQ